MIYISDRKYQEKFKVAFIVFAVFVTYCFGYFQGQTTINESRNFGMLAIAGNVILLSLIAFIGMKIKLKFEGSVYLYAFLIWTFVITFFRDNREVSVNHYFNSLFTQSFILLLANIFWRIPFAKLIKWILLYLHIVLLISLFVQLTKIGPIQFGTHREGRFGGLFFYGITGDLAGFGAMLSLYVFLNVSKYKDKLFWMGSFLIFVIYTLAADMRSALLATSLAFFIQIIFKRISLNKSIAPAFFIGFVLYLSLQVYKSINSGGANINDDIQIRQAIWTVALIGVSQQPLFGYGDYGPVLTRLSFVKNNLMAGLSETHDPHSSFLGLILESGVVAFIIFLIMLVKPFFNLKHYPGFNKAVLSFFIYWIVVASVGGNYFDFTFNIGAVFFELTFFGLVIHPDVFNINASNNQLSKN